ncbi:MAG: oxygenase MpaB family protein [Sciscionella sp.]
MAATVEVTGAAPAARSQPDTGLVGPDSVTWQLHCDPSMWIGGIRSLYLQALHPRAVAGVVQNSDFQRDPLGRLFRTGHYVALTTYGTTHDAHRAAARVRGVHRRLRATDRETGETFRIDDPDLLLWVHCAEVASFLDVARLAGFALTNAQADRYFDEQRAVAALMGLDAAEVPGSVSQMASYFADMRPRLRMSEDAELVYRFLHRPPLNNALRLGIPAYERLMGHLAYSLLPRWGLRMYSHRGYPWPVASSMLHAARSAAVRAPRRTPFIGWGPQVWDAVDRLGRDAMPSEHRLPTC